MSRRSKSPYLLVADDDPHFLRLMEHHLKNWSYRVEVVAEKGALLKRLAAERPDLLLMDVRFGEHDGVEVLRQVMAAGPGLRVAMLTAYGSIDGAVGAIRLGAVDYLTKPVDLNRLRAMISHALDTQAPAGAAAEAPRPTPPPDRLEPTRPILGESAPMRELRALIRRVAATEATVLVLGESGTGKELVARAIHELGPRHRGPFVPLNVAALPRELVESTLFGHTKGAFTGADQPQQGCCEAADGGTLFLDEIGEMEMNLQAKLLRFLQERTFQRVGQPSPIGVDVRIVAATHRSPLEQIRKGQLREDLYYRLNVVPIHLPPLRARRDDIPLLAAHFLARACARSNRPPMAFTPEALAALAAHPWPGNARELENLVERLAILEPGPDLGAGCVASALGAPPAPGPPDVEGRPIRTIDEGERDAIVRALEVCRGNVREAARNLGLGHATIYRKMQKYGIQNRWNGR